MAIGDSTSAIGWLFNTSQLCADTTVDYRAHLFAARHLATLLITHRCCLASQHIKGELNVVADLLSFAGSGERGKPHPLAHDHPPNDVLTQRFLQHLTEQVPETFQISQLPNEITSWVMQALQIAVLCLTAARKTATKGPTESGGVGSASAPKPATPLTPSSFCYPSTNANFSSRHSSSATAQRLGPHPDALRESVTNLWSQALSAKPQATWLRRFGAICGTAPCTSRGVPTFVPS